MVLPELVHSQVAERPSAVAVEDLDGRSLTYAELWAAAGRVGAALRDAGVEPDARVVVWLPRESALLSGLLGVWRAQAAFVPVDVATPLARLRHVVRHSRAAAVLTTADRADDLDLEDTPVVVVAMDGPDPTSRERKAGPPPTRPEALAYVMYTSGSSGAPKGVAIRHRNLASACRALGEAVGLEPGKRVLAATTIAFDISMLETVIPLARGSTVVLVDEAAQRDYGLLRERIVGGRVDHVQLTPSRLQLLVEHDPRLESLARVEVLMVGGERFSDALLARLAPFAGRIVNLYGPTETTIYSLVGDVRPGERVCIGAPITGTQVRIAAPDGEPVEDGAIGELWIAGEGVAQGYLFDSERSAGVFIDDPRGELGPVYRTGDRVRRSDGRYWFHGRFDRQLKVRGHRVEPAEVERALTSLAGIRRAAVCSHTDGAGEYLCAYLCADVRPRDGEVYGHLARMLPEYMIPSLLVWLDALPTNDRGKIDYARLRPPSAPETPVQPPRGPTEEALASIWGDVLGVPSTSVDAETSFFVLGGHSLRGALLSARVESELGVRLPMSVLFANPTLRSQATWIDAAEREPVAPRPVRARSDVLPMSAEQGRMLFLDQLAEAPVYNITEVYRVFGEPDLARIEATFAALLARHASLRTSFRVDDDGVARQRVGDPDEVRLEVETRTCTDAELDAVLEAIVRPFDLARAPLARLTLVQGERARWLVFDVHHIVVDGVSRDVLVEEFAALYEGRTLPAVGLAYADYLLWHDSWLERRGRAQARFWRARLDPPPDRLRLPRDRPRPPRRGFRGRRIPLRLTPAQGAALRELAVDEGATPFMVVLAAVGAILGRICGQDDLVVGTPCAGRRGAFARTVGMFVNTLPLRLRPRPELAFKELLATTRAEVIAALDHADYPFDRIVRDVADARGTATGQRGRNALFDVMVVVQDTELGEWAIPGLELQAVPRDPGRSMLDLFVSLREQGAGFDGFVEYDVELFEEATAVWLRDQLGSGLRRIAESRGDIRVAEVFGEPRGDSSGAGLDLDFELRLDSAPLDDHRHTDRGEVGP